jgi:hypothetical protein
MIFGPLLRICFHVRCLAFAAGLIWYLAPFAAWAEPSDPTPDWSGQITLYAWGAGVGGNITPVRGAPRLTFDESLSDILADLDAALFMTGFARRGDLVLFGDLSYSKSSRKGTVPPGVRASGSLRQRALTFAAGRRVLHGDTTVDLMAGLRAWWIEGEVRVPMAGVSTSPDRNLLDPILALRVNTQLAPRWSLLSYVDLGGFGVGSDLTWQVALTANYEVNERLYLSAGYRHLVIDYAKNGTVFDAAMSGPLLGLTWRF